MQVRRDEYRLSSDHGGVQRRAEAKDGVRVQVRERLVEQDQRDLLRLDTRE